MDNNHKQNNVRAACSFAGMHRTQRDTDLEKPGRNPIEHRSTALEILVVDDSVSMRHFLRQEITKEGY